ncbi:MAG: hypothetical protein QOJ69_331 [Actinomycetota bacterium]|jgi:hypothetical protein|nr:hypothetical protein [Actinomycetota bacterium]MEA2842660.1 hypothetical protein [Actinomycetota bacterium]
MRTMKTGWKFGAVGVVVAASLLVVLPRSEATFPGTNGLIAWTTGGVIFTARPDGTQQSAKGSGDNPAWSADGTYLTFDRSGDVWTMLATGAGGAQLTNTGTVDNQPVFNRAGTQIAFASNRSGQFRIWKMNVDGSSPVAVTTTGSLPAGSEDASPDWSPDGQRIVFSRGVPADGAGATDIFSVKADGSDLQRLTSGPSAPGGGPYDKLVNPKWSPDGSKVTYGLESGCAIFTVNANGTGAAPVGTFTGCATDPTYSPDGTLILFRLTNGPQGSGLYGFRPSANTLAQLVNDAAAKVPDWQPLGGPPPPTSSTTAVPTSSTTPGQTTSSTSTTVAPPPAGATKPLVVRDGTWYFRNTFTTGKADSSFGYGDITDRPVTGDWDGNGTITAGVVRNGTWYLRNASGGISHDVPAFVFGNPTDIPLSGDWDDNGTWTPGVYRNGVWYLRNSLTSGVADVTINYGNATGDTPVAGDWDGDGRTTIGVVRNGTWYLRNAEGGSSHDVTPFVYGNASGDTPVVGDWNGNGTFTPGVFRSGTWYLRNGAGGGIADVPSFIFGNPTDKPRIWR